MTSEEQHPEKGRHRHSQGTWTPQVGHANPPAHALPEPVLAPPTVAEMTGPGLRKFDLGTIPASVTPPKTWRKAAWFAVGSSLAVVVSLSFAASALVGRPKNTETIDALPGVPSAPVFLDVSAGPVPSRSPKPADRVVERSAVAAVPNQSHRGTTGGPAASRTVRTSGPQSTGSPPSSPPPPATPLRETTPKRALAMNDPEQIGDRTEAFYEQVTAAPDAAYQMTTGEMRMQGKEAFRQRYADIKAVEVYRICIDPNQGTTLSEVKITKKDGSTITERRRLKFTSGRDPKIRSEVTH
ncbi:hypothetical protein KIPE111705_34580 [Kibdelosporangium persicum]|uniref:Uncharacterized protein n=1 Tax=Kibdelosporangium persicum TaxID=2698649 RepID=A0ABX2EZX2_9PSEU|nr:hypothetical protein [Kibdelosporangium persicum]NRN64598.1 hypothetical protein [Kibdelosporangium persicum]